MTIIPFGPSRPTPEQLLPTVYRLREGHPTWSVELVVKI